MLSWMSQVPELLQAAGVITDITTPGIVLGLRDGSAVTTEAQPMTFDEYGSVQRVRTAPGVELPMAASRRDEATWWTVEPITTRSSWATTNPADPPRQP